MNGARDLSLTLDYRHGLGELAPYFAALSQGHALAAACPECSRCWFPPRPRCPEDGAATVLRQLPGTGTVRADTMTTTRLPFTDQAAPQHFVLVAIDGATNLTFGRMRDAATQVAPDQRVRLIADPGQAPIFVNINTKPD